MSEKYSGTLSQETGFRVKMKNGHLQAEQRFIFCTLFGKKQSLIKILSGNKFPII
jgi:hypothetical protein